MNWAHTLRGRLTLWNLAVITVTLTLFGFLLTLANHRRLEAQIDRDLVDRARQFARRPPLRFQFPQPGARERRRDDRIDVRHPQYFSPDGEMQIGDFADEPYDQALATAVLRGRSGFANSTYRGVPVRVFALRIWEGPFDGAGAPGQGGEGGQGAGGRGGRGGAAGQAGEPGQPGDSANSDVMQRQRGLAGPNGRPIVDGGGVPERPGRAGRAWVVEVAQDVGPFQSLLHVQILTLAFVLPIAIFVAGLGALFLTNAALKPIADVTEAASQISEKNLSQRLAVTGKDELANLSLTFNAMIDRLQAAFKNQRQAYVDLEVAYENQRRFTADASHELRTPLTRLRLATSTALSQKADSAAVAEAMKVADQAADAMSTIVGELLLLAQADSGTLRMELKPVDLRVVAADAADSCTDPSRIGLQLGETPVMAEADQEHLKRVVLNLLENAIKHTEKGRPICLSVWEEPAEARIVVEDHGEGIAPAHLPHLGERFYRVDAARSRAEGGFGLGLAICKSILDAHHGSLTFESELGKGTTAFVHLPKNQNA